MKMQDHIFIDDFEVSCRVGDTAEERAFPQPITLSIKIFFDFRKAIQADDISKTIDYAEICEEVRESFKNNSFVLIETVANKVADIALSHPMAERAWVKASKKSFPKIGGVGAAVVREKV